VFSLNGKETIQPASENKKYWPNWTHLSFLQGREMRGAETRKMAWRFRSSDQTPITKRCSRYYESNRKANVMFSRKIERSQSGLPAVLGDSQCGLSFSWIDIQDSLLLHEGGESSGLSLWLRPFSSLCACLNHCNHSLTVYGNPGRNTGSHIQFNFRRVTYLSKFRNNHW